MNVYEAAVDTPVNLSWLNDANIIFILYGNRNLFFYRNHVGFDEYIKEDIEFSHNKLEVQDYNLSIKTAVTKAISFIPEVGGLLSNVFSAIWPDLKRKEMDVWGKVEKQTRELCEELISEERVENLQQEIEGMENLVRQYQETNIKSEQKGQLFTSLIAKIVGEEPKFFNQTKPEKTLHLFLCMGTLCLTVFREQYLFYTNIYNTKEDLDRDKHLMDLQRKITEYSNGLYHARSKALSWRLSKITVSEKITEIAGGLNHFHEWSASDSMGDGWRKAWGYADVDAGGVHDARQRAEFECERRKKEVAAEFNAQLDVLLGSAYVWIYLDPTQTAKPSLQNAWATSGPFGGRSGTAFTDIDIALSRITKVIIYADSRVDGVEIFYGCKSVLHGGRGVNAKTLLLDADEDIVSAYGVAGDAMDALYFRTNKGKIIGGGGAATRTALPWFAFPPLGEKGVLGFIEGVKGDVSFHGITLHWKYSVWK